jgi:hypothetical protein
MLGLGHANTIQRDDGPDANPVDNQGNHECRVPRKEDAAKYKPRSDQQSDHASTGKIEL